MPELPEVETVVRELKHLIGDQIVSLKVHWFKTVNDKEKIFRTQLLKQPITDVFRRGKYICFAFKNKVILTIHLRMTGKLVFSLSKKDHKHCRLEFGLKANNTLYFIDIRKFGRMELWEENNLLPDLGPEPLEKEIVYNALLKYCGKKEIKKVLLDQKILVGVGNIYADEALFQAKIHPELKFNTISKKRIAILSEVIPKILKASIKNMGTTLSDYRTTKNVGGENQNYLKVYGQTGLACEQCQSTIKRIVVGGRSSHFCPVCQKK